MDATHNSQAFWLSRRFPKDVVGVVLDFLVRLNCHFTDHIDDFQELASDIMYEKRSLIHSIPYVPIKLPDPMPFTVCVHGWMRYLAAEFHDELYTIFQDWRREVEDLVGEDECYQ